MTDVNLYKAVADANRKTRILQAISAERRNQDVKWGEQNHEPDVWLGILMEEVGELAQTILAWRFDKDREIKMHASHSSTMSNEAIQVAAVATAFVECLERNGYEDLVVSL